MTGLSEHQLSLDAGSVVVTVEGNGPPLVLLHANPGTSKDFDAIAPALADKFRVYRPDWPGYGRSTLNPPPHTVQPDTFATCLEQIINDLQLTNVVLAGSSLGGYAALRVGLSQPERIKALILAAPAGFTRHNQITRAFCHLQGIPSLNRRIAAGFAGRYIRVQNEWTEQILSRTRSAASEVSALSASLWRSFATLEVEELSTNLEVPTLLVWGKRDPVAPLKSTGERAQRILGAPIAALPCGHFPYAELPDAFTERVVSFIEQLESNDGRAKRQEQGLHRQKD